MPVGKAAPKHRVERVALITGGRDTVLVTEDYKWFEEILRKWRITLVRHGAARGVDTDIGTWCRHNFYRQDACPVTREEHEKYRTKGGKSYAPMIRNQRILDKDPRPVVCIQFPGGKGTQDMVNRCLKAHVPIEHQDEERFHAWSNVVRHIPF